MDYYANILATVKRGKDATPLIMKHKEEIEMRLMSNRAREGLATNK